MGEEERPLRFASPALYQVLVEVFAEEYLHPYDVQGFLKKSEKGLQVIVRFPAAFPQSMEEEISEEQAVHPDTEAVQFFREAAKACRAAIIADYNRMIKL